LNVAAIEFAAIDFESAGSAPGLTDEPVQVAIVQMRGWEIRENFSSYIRPTRAVTWAARAVHGIGDPMVSGAPRLVDLWPEVKRGLGGRWVVAHGAATERRFLRAFPVHGFGPWIDTLTLARRVFPTLASYALSDAVGALGLSGEAELSRPGFRWHDAVSDAVATLVLLRRLVVAAGLSNSDAEELLRVTRGT
jgi:DNA polymerase-3 subunit epsilon